MSKPLSKMTKNELYREVQKHRAGQPPRGQGNECAEIRWAEAQPGENAAIKAHPKLVSAWVRWRSRERLGRFRLRSARCTTPC